MKSLVHPLEKRKKGKTCHMNLKKLPLNMAWHLVKALLYNGFLDFDNWLQIFEMLTLGNLRGLTEGKYLWCLSNLSSMKLFQVQRSKGKDIWQWDWNEREWFSLTIEMRNPHCQLVYICKTSVNINRALANAFMP